jgi:hypothetical protein
MSMSMFISTGTYTCTSSCTSMSANFAYLKQSSIFSCFIILVQSTSHIIAATVLTFSKHK